MKNAKAKKIAYWIFTILGPASFIVGGVLHLAGAEQPLSQFAHLGYPAYLAVILGMWKVLGAIVVVLPKLPLLKEWAYAGFFFALTGAAMSHNFAGDPFVANGPAQIMPPLLFLVFVAISWALRPADRRLPGTDVFGVNSDV